MCQYQDVAVILPPRIAGYHSYHVASERTVEMLGILAAEGEEAKLPESPGDPECSLRASPCAGSPAPAQGVGQKLHLPVELVLPYGIVGLLAAYHAKLPDIDRGLGGSRARKAHE